MRWLAIWTGFLALAAVVVGAATLGGLERHGEDSPLEGAAVEERLGAVVPLDARFVDMEGHDQLLAEFVARGIGAEREGLPVLLILAYHRCRTLCSLVLEGTARSLAGVERRAGEEYRVVSVSIDPRDTPADSREKAAELGASLGVEGEGGGGPPGWSFLTGEDQEIEMLAASLGFRYRYDPASDQYSHPAVIFALTPKGEVSSYIYGVNPEPAELAAALDVAASGRSRSTVERILLRCFHYIPALRRHAGAITTILRVGGVMTILGAGILLRRLILRAPGGVRAG